MSLAYDDHFTAETPVRKPDLRKRQLIRLAYPHVEGMDSSVHERNANYTKTTQEHLKKSRSKSGKMRILE